MSKTSEAEQLARAWIDGWNAGKPDEIPLAADFEHSSPFGTVKGREKYLDWVRPLAAQNVTNLTILKTLGGETEAAIWFEMETPHGIIHVCDWVQTHQGTITSIRSFYDATALRGTE